MFDHSVDSVQFGKDVALAIVGIAVGVERALNIISRVRSKNGERRHDNPGHGICKAQEVAEPLRAVIERFEHVAEKLSEQISHSVEHSTEQSGQRHTEIMSQLAAIRTWQAASRLTSPPESD